MAKKIPDDVLAVLDAARKEGSRVILVGQLDRQLYERVNKVLAAAGGKWSRSAKAHVFGTDAAPIIEAMILTGEYFNEKQDFGVFFTPQLLAQRAAARCQIKPGMKVLEPSAGQGALAIAARAMGGDVFCVEILHRNIAVLVDEGFACQEADFMLCDAPQDPIYDRVLMNPPFANGHDALHVLHALDFLKQGGRLVAIVSAAVTFRTTKIYRRLQQIISSRGSIETLPPGSFKASGTMVNTVIVEIEKP